MSTQTSFYGAIRAIKLPQEFVKGEEYINAFGPSWNVTYNPRETDDVEICFLYSGSPISNFGSTGLRLLLEKPPHVVVHTKGREQTLPDTKVSLLCELEEVLGNAGNNQITNQKKGAAGPRFHLDKIETLDLNMRRVLVVTGWFHNHEGKMQNNYQGIFFDGSPTQDSCAVEEIIFQTRTHALFDEYWDQFKSALLTIEWNDNSSN